MTNPCFSYNLTFRSYLRDSKYKALIHICNPLIEPGHELTYHFIENLDYDHKVNIAYFKVFYMLVEQRPVYN